MNNGFFLVSMSVAVLAIAACGPTAEPRGGNDKVTRVFTDGFSAPLIDRSARTIGTVTGRADKQGLVVAFGASGLSPGSHGVHLHSAGRCDPPGFASSGQHWNVSGHQHGTDNPAGPHDGDWGNLEVGADGRGSLERLIPRWHGKIPESGLSLVIHARPDDGMTDPDGNSGERIACAVVIAGG